MGGKGVEPQLVAPRLPGGGGIGGGGVGCLKVPGGVGGGGGGFMFVAAWRSVSLIADGTFVVSGKTLAECTSFLLQKEIFIF